MPTTSVSAPVQQREWPANWPALRASFLSHVCTILPSQILMPASGNQPPTAWPLVLHD